MDNIDVRSASENGHIEVVKYLVLGADIQASTMRYGMRGNGHLVVKFLVSLGADLQAIDNYAVVASERVIYKLSNI